jgi:hypothetical protein
MTNNSINQNTKKSWNTNQWAKCECSCGETVLAPLNAVVKGYVKSCGHLRTQNAVALLDECRDSTHNAVYLTHEDKTMNITEWSKETGIPRTTIMYRMSKGLPVDKILERKDCNEEENPNYASGY